MSDSNPSVCSSSYEQSLGTLYRLTSRGMKLGLERVTTACVRLGSPHEKLAAVQIAGTNGKGTVSTLVARTAQIAGLRTGLFTSPHLHRFTERFRIDGEEVSPLVLAPHLAEAISLTTGNDPIALTFFELATIAALRLFEKEKVDLAVLEVGLGGRLDATSVVMPLVSAITSIGLDHMQILGDSEEAIAGEKAAIARRGVPMIAGALSFSVAQVVQRACENAGAPIRMLGVDFDLTKTLRPPWPGLHQRQNASVALEVCRMLAGSHFPQMTETIFHAALATATWPGRYERICTTAEFLLDGAHNMPAVLALEDALNEQNCKIDTLLFGALQDKPFIEMLTRLMPLARRTILVRAPIERTFDAALFAAQLHVEYAESVATGLEMSATGLSHPDAVTLVTGSLFTVAKARQILRNEAFDPPVGL